ncbi:MAG: glycosyltransferase family 2 protein [Bacteroidetes bacterium]|nr:MAG: glycosyltransferase family 2 protein [Bacteroidota bacterium]
MLSICIPVYNYDVRELVNQLHKQAQDELQDFEIILMDDASQEKYRELNRECSQFAHVKLIELEKNVGRSHIRNLLAEKAVFSQIIFMDCDSLCPDYQYIQRYTAYLEKEGVVCGGRIYNHIAPNDDTLLHWTFGKKREAIPAKIRKKKPNKSFMTNNFLISKSIFEKVKFNEKINSYGHEDTLFGFELLKHEITIQHIDNPLIHEDLQPTADFMKKTETAIENLIKIYQITGFNPALKKTVKLLNTWSILKKLRLTSLCRFIFQYLRKPILSNISGKNPSLFLLDIYKLGIICSIPDSTNKI